MFWILRFQRLKLPLLNLYLSFKDEVSCELNHRIVEIKENFYLLNLNWVKIVKTFQVIGFGAMGAASTATAVAIQCVI